MNLLGKYSSRFLAKLLVVSIIMCFLPGHVLGAQTVDSAGELSTVEDTDISEDEKESGEIQSTEEGISESVDVSAVLEESSSAGETEQSATDVIPELSEDVDSSENTDSEQIATDTNTETAETGNTVQEDIKSFPEDQSDEFSAEDELSEDIKSDSDSSEDASQLTDDKQVIQEAPIEESISTEAQNGESTEFTIVDGVLQKYRGTGGDVVIPEGVTSIGEEAFYECSVLSSITIPEGVTSIGKNAFADCYGLENISFPRELTSIGENAFVGCTALKSITLLEGLTNIGTGAFLYCCNLVEVTLPEGLTSIGGGAFDSCNKLTSIILPEGVKSIGDNAFYNCSSLVSITVPDSLTQINGTPFTKCDLLTIYCSSSNSGIMEYAAENHIPFCGDQIYTVAGNTLISYNKSGGEVSIPEGVKIIGEGAFSNSWELKEIDLPESVTILKDCAFCKCENLVCISMPGVKKIGNCAFKDCSSLTDITVPDSVTSIEYETFCNCSSLTNVALPANLTSIANEAFNNCPSLTSIVVPEGVLSIDYLAFCECTSLTSVSLPKSLTSIGFGAFQRCISLTDITLPESLTSVGSGLFYWCSSLESIKLPDSIVYLDEAAFNECASLTNVILPNSLTNIGNSMFRGCGKLANITIPESVTSIGTYAFYDCTELTNVILPNGTTKIGEYAFYNCSNMTSITIPASVTEIGEHAFDGAYNVVIHCPENAEYVISFAEEWEIPYETYPSPVSTISLSETDISLNKGSEFTITALIDSSEIVAGDVIWSSSDTEVVTVDNSGIINAVEVGTAIITATAAKDSNVKATCTVHVSQAFSEENVSVTETSFTYDGNEKEPDVLVRLDEHSLVRGTDYTVCYSDNKNAGTASVTVTGIGNYSGSVTKKFIINRAAQVLTFKAAKASINVGNTTTVKAGGAKETSYYTYSSANTSVATVSSNGTVTGKMVGSVKITVKTPQTANYNASSKTVIIKITAPQIKKPGNCRFMKWNNSKYTSCNIAWNKVAGAHGYQTVLSWTNGSHASTMTVKSNVLSRNCSVKANHVSQMKVRAFVKVAGKTYYGSWSNVAFITPSPAKITTKNISTSSNNLKIKSTWNTIYGCNGYNVFLTTNPNGKWYWNQSTATKANATTAVITKYRGAKLKKNTRYYIRIVTRRRQKGVFCTVPMPAKNTYVGSFIIK